MNTYIVHVRHAEKTQCKVTMIPSVKVRFVKEDIKVHTLFFFYLSPGLNQVLVLPFSWKNDWENSVEICRTCVKILEPRVPSSNVSGSKA